MGAEKFPSSSAGARRGAAERLGNGDGIKIDALVEKVYHHAYSLATRWVPYGYHEGLQLVYRRFMQQGHMPAFYNALETGPQARRGEWNFEAVRSAMAGLADERGFCWRRLWWREMVALPRPKLT